MMEEIIRDMLREADLPAAELSFRDEKRKLIEFSKRLIEELANTLNAPANWRKIGTTLADEWNNGTWEFDTSYEHGSMFDMLDLRFLGADECFGVAALVEMGDCYE